MLLRFTNTALLALVIVLTLSGLWGIAFTLQGWVFEAHRIAGWAVIALIPWKTIISVRSLRRGLDFRFDRSWMIGLSLLLAALTLGVLALGLGWTWRIGPQLLWLGSYGDTLISWHWMLALVLLAPLAVHVWRRWPRPKPTDFLSRRGALKLLGLAGAGAVGWLVAQRLAAARAAPDSPRRFTGSAAQGSFAGNDFPVTNSGGSEGQAMLDAATYFLVVRGAVKRPFKVSYATLATLPQTDVSATIDCTTGWYSTQTWRGVSLQTLLNEAGIAAGAGLIRLRGVSGYFGDFTLPEAAEVLLATQVGGQMLDHWHGYPVRAVAPSRRGWFWIKWLTEVEVLAPQKI
jgi:DMSO/TMAO reductase YedYZ molybdopterin-dependent catalytic subunit